MWSSVPDLVFRVQNARQRVYQRWVLGFEMLKDTNMTDEQIAKGNISSRLFHFFHRIRAYGLPVILGLIMWVVWLALRSVSSTLRVGATLAAAGSSVLLLLLKTPQWQISN